MHPPQDEIPLCVSNKEIFNSVLDLATVRVPRELEAATGAISEMRAIAAGHVTNAASGIHNANNPITLIDSQVSSLLKILSKFNDVVSNVATVWYYTI